MADSISRSSERSDASTVAHDVERSWTTVRLSPTNKQRSRYGNGGFPAEVGTTSASSLFAPHRGYLAEAKRVIHPAGGHWQTTPRHSTPAVPSHARMTPRSRSAASIASQSYLAEQGSDDEARKRLSTAEDADSLSRRLSYFSPTSLANRQSVERRMVPSRRFSSGQSPIGFNRFSLERSPMRYSLENPNAQYSNAFSSEHRGISPLGQRKFASRSRLSADVSPMRWPNRTSEEYEAYSRAGRRSRRNWRSFLERHSVARSAQTRKSRVPFTFHSDDDIEKGRSYATSSLAENASSEKSCFVRRTVATRARQTTSNLSPPAHSRPSCRSSRTKTARVTWHLTSSRVSRKSSTINARNTPSIMRPIECAPSEPDGFMWGSHRLVQSIYFQCGMLMCVVLSVIVPDLLVALQITRIALCDATFVSIFTVFMMETIVLLVAGDAVEYAWLDLAVTTSVLIDVNYVSNFYHPRKLVTTRTVDSMLRFQAPIDPVLMTLTIRFCRVCRLLKIMRYHAIFTALFDSRRRGHAHRMYDLSRKLRQRLVGVVVVSATVLVVLGSMLSMFTEPQDLSMSVWVELLYSNCQSVGSLKCSALTKKFEAFYANHELDHFPLNISVRGNMKKYFVFKNSTARQDSLVEVSSLDATVVAIYDFSEADRIKSAVFVTMIGITIVTIVLVGFCLSREVARIVFCPLEKLLSRVYFMMKDVFDPEDTNEECECTFILENVIKRLADIGKASVKKPQKMELGLVGSTFKHANDYAAVETLPDIGLTQRAPESTLDVDVFAWEFNPFTLSKVEINRVAEWMLYYSPSTRIRLPNGEKEVRLLVMELRRGYIETNSYHNWHHAVDVAQALFFLIDKLCLHFLPWHERAGLAVSALAHDVGHIARNNSFLVETHHELAIQYNDRSPLENMHCAMLFDILSHDASHVFKHFTRSMFCDVRKVCVESILSTDNALHFEMVKEIDIFTTVNAEVLDTAWDPSVSNWTSEAIFLLSGAEQRLLLWKIALHWADISNPMRPFDTCRMWAFRIMDEFFGQGDHEKQLGLPVGMLNDRETVHIPSAQIGFLEFVVFPFSLAMTRILEPAREFNLNLIENAYSWCKHTFAEDEEKAASLLMRVQNMERKNT